MIPAFSRRRLGAACALALLAAGCSGRNEDTGPLPFFTDKAAWEPSFADMNSASAGTGLTLDFTGYSDQVTYDSFIKQSFRTKERPDLFTWHTGSQLRELVANGLLAETTGLWRGAESEGNVPAGLKESFTVDGHQYGVPLNSAYWVMYYNRKVFAQHDLEPPDTWTDLKAAARTLKKSGVVPFFQMNMIFEFAWFQALLMGRDPQLYRNLQTGEASYTDPVVHEVMDTWRAMLRAGWFLDPGVATDPQTLLAQGHVAMAYYGTFFTGQLTSVGAEAGEDYGIFLLPNLAPEVETQQVALETGPLCAGADTHREEECLDYSGWWMSRDAQQAWTDSRGEPSFNPKVQVDDPELSDLLARIQDPDADVEIQERYLEATPLPVYTASQEVFGDFVTNAPDPTKGLERLQAESESYWREENR
ncbi:ABC transporter substrate-binding protein [Brachybacterium kimchii]|uniref:Extracellular solute-binding protein n=1 Tax=Brachybacterium kimchii TaxID=2942909 RepID=A0ABY4N695_9MICO|nr:extracellular solute-binding protein [Brachybacterium kimchii]UQN28925.1 extracellular solute-binding protein [Brachybacterium kimchii]